MSPRSAAAKAGLKAGDVVLRVNDRSIHDAKDLRNAIGLLEIGEAARLEILRDGQSLAIDAKVGEYVPAKTVGKELNPRLAGAVFEDIGPNSPLAGRVRGVLISEIQSGSPAARAGLRADDVIAGVNRHAITNTQELQELASASGSLVLNLIRGQNELYLMLR